MSALNIITLVYRLLQIEPAVYIWHQL